MLNLRHIDNLRSWGFPDIFLGKSAGVAKAMRTELWVIEIMNDDDEWVIIRNATPKSEFLLKGTMAAFETRKDAQTVSNYVTFGRTQHRIRKYVPENEVAK